MPNIIIKQVAYGIYYYVNVYHSKLAILISRKKILVLSKKLLKTRENVVVSIVRIFFSSRILLSILFLPRIFTRIILPKIRNNILVQFSFSAKKQQLNCLNQAK